MVYDVCPYYYFAIASARLFDKTTSQLNNIFVFRKHKEKDPMPSN